MGTCAMSSNGMSASGNCVGCADGLAPASEPDVAVSDARAQVYMNAITWRIQQDTYIVDRYDGRLTIEPGSRLLQCMKNGGRKF
jgi:hypothetical protein